MHRVIAAAIIKDGKILIAKRNYGTLKDYWEFPGGKVEGHETDIECLKREIMEELMVQLKVEEFLGEQSVFIDRTEYMIVLYRAVLLDDTFELNAHSEIAWVETEQLYRYELAPVDEMFVQQRCLEGLV